MPGTALIYRPGQAEPEVVALAAPPDLEFLQKVVGGYIELVPRFLTIEHAGAKHDCVAFCNEHGKLDGLPLNEFATALWQRALGPPGLRRPDGSLVDFLSGPVIALFGDPEFVGSL